MNYLVGAIIFLFVLFLAAKGRLGLYASMLFYTAPGDASTGSGQAAPSSSSGPTQTDQPATNAGVLHNTITPFNAIPQIGNALGGAWNWLMSPPSTGAVK